MWADTWMVAECYWWKWDYTQIVLMFSQTPGVLSGTSVMAKYGTISVCRTNDGQWQPNKGKKIRTQDHAGLLKRLY